MAGILASGSFLLGKSLGKYLLILCGLLVAGLIISMFIQKDKVCRPHRLKVVALFVLSIVLGASLFCTVIGYKAQKRDDLLSRLGSESASGVIIGRVCEIKEGESKNTLVLESIKINDTTLDCKITISTTASEIKLGDNLRFEGKIFIKSVASSSFDQNLITKNIFFSGYAIGDIEVLSNNMTLIERIQNKTTADLELYGGDNAGILKALLLGDKNGIDDNQYIVFQKSGIAHILSVSGLHVGFIVMMIMFVLKKLKANSKVQFFGCMGFLIFYCIICGMASSVVRATIMTLCFLLSRVVGKRSDGLSSLGLAGIIVLLINPLYLYNIGFQLSFGAVFGIVLIGKPIQTLFEKCRIPEVFASSLAVTISAQLFTLPIVIRVFGKIAILGFLSNILILPLFSIYFGILFVVFLVNILLPLGVLYYPLGIVFNLFLSVSAVIGSAGFITLNKMHSLVEVIYYVAIFMLSNYILEVNWKKVVSATLVVTMIVVTSVIDTTTFNDNYTVFENIENAMLVRTKSSGNILILDELDDTEMLTLRQTLSNMEVSKIDYLVLTGDSSNIDNLGIIARLFKAKRTYISSALEQTEIARINSTLSCDVVACDLLGVNITASTYFSAIIFDGKLNGFYIDNSGEKVCYFNSKIDAEKLGNLEQRVCYYAVFDYITPDIYSGILSGKILVKRIACKKAENNFLKTINSYYFTYSF